MTRKNDTMQPENAATYPALEGVASTEVEPTEAADEKKIKQKALPKLKTQAPVIPITSAADEKKKWGQADISSDILKVLDRSVKEGTFQKLFPEIAKYRTFRVSTSDPRTLMRLRKFEGPDLLSDFDQSIVPRYLVELVNAEDWQDALHSLFQRLESSKYGKSVELSNQMRIAKFAVPKLPTLLEIPIFLQKSEPGVSWARLPFDLQRVLLAREDSDGNLILNENGRPTYPENLAQIMEFLERAAPHWFNVMSRASNQLAFMAWCGALVTPSVKLQMYLYLFGNGNDSKGSIINVLSKAFGSASVALTWPRNPDKHFTSQLEGKRVAFLPDQDPTKVIDSDLFKRVTGDPVLTADHKGKKPYDFINHTMIMMASNKRPAIPAEAHGERRPIIVEMQPHEKTDPGFEEGLFEELDNFLSACKYAYDMWGEHSRVPTDPEVMLRNHEAINFEIRNFIEQHFIATSFDHMERQKVSECDMPKISQIEFSAFFREYPYKLPFSAAQLKGYLEGVLKVRWKQAKDGTGGSNGRFILGLQFKSPFVSFSGKIS